MMTRLPSAEIAVVLGSGLGNFANILEQPQFLAYQQIPNFPISTVEGHSGQMVYGLIKQKPVLVMQGRVHRYEGYTAQQVVFPIRMLRDWGVKKLIITNAAGGIREDLKAGDLMLISDHLNLTGDNPLLGPNDPRLGLRFLDMSDAYSKKWRNLAKSIEPSLEEGVYAGLLGPCYETPAEVRMLRGLGADAVGMSTVFETIAAKHMGMEVLGLSCISNPAAGLSSGILDHQDVISVVRKSSERMIKLLNQLVLVS